MIRTLLVITLLLMPLYGCKKEVPKSPKPQAQKVKPETQKASPQIEEKKVETESYTYNPAGRKDPFLSIIEVTKKEKEGVKKKRAVKPAEAFDVNDIRIIAIAWEGNRYYAMVQLPDGKYFTLKEGMTVGLYGGKVIKIDQNTVVVREFIKDYKGDIKPKDTILKLRKEEGE